MDDREKGIEREIREEIRRSKKAPRRKRGGAARRALLSLLMAAAVLGAVGYAAGRGMDGMDSLRRLLTYHKDAQDADGRLVRFRYDSDRGASYTALGDGLLIVSATHIRQLGEDGRELWAQTVNLSNPAVESCGDLAAVYDVGGRSLYVLGTRGLVRDMSAESGSGILSVSLNASGCMALTTLKSGYRASVTAYDPSGAPLFTFHSSERYISEARVLDNGRGLAVVTLGAADGLFASTVTLYSFDSEQAASETVFSGSMVLALGSVGRRLSVLQDDRLMFFDADGSLAGSFRFDYPYLRGASMDGDGFAVLLFSRYRSGSVLRLVAVDTEGGVLGALDERREIVDVSAAGDYIAVLYSGSLTIYKKDLTVYATLDDAGFARQAVMRADGTVLLIGASDAWLYVPA